MVILKSLKGRSRLLTWWSGLHLKWEKSSMVDRHQSEIESLSWVRLLCSLLKSLMGQEWRINKIKRSKEEYRGPIDLLIAGEVVLQRQVHRLMGRVRTVLWNLCCKVRMEAQVREQMPLTTSLYMNRNNKRRFKVKRLLQ